MYSLEFFNWYSLVFSLYSLVFNLYSVVLFNLYSLVQEQVGLELDRCTDFTPSEQTEEAGGAGAWGGGGREGLRPGGPGDRKEGFFQPEPQHETPQFQLQGNDGDGLGSPRCERPGDGSPPDNADGGADVVGAWVARCKEAQRELSQRCISALDSIAARLESGEKESQHRQLGLVMGEIQSALKKLPPMLAGDTWETAVCLSSQAAFTLSTYATIAMGITGTKERAKLREAQVTIAKEASRFIKVRFQHPCFEICFL